MVNLNFVPQRWPLAFPYPFPLVHIAKSLNNRALITTSEGPFVNISYKNTCKDFFKCEFFQFQKHFFQFRHYFSSQIFNLKLKFALNYLTWLILIISLKLTDLEANYNTFSTIQVPPVNLDFSASSKSFQKKTAIEWRVFFPITIF